jgi:ribosomal protein L29
MKKKFDAVKFQRKVREELSKKYSTDRDAFLRELKEKYANSKTEMIATHIR